MPLAIMISMAGLAKMQMAMSYTSMFGGLGGLEYPITENPVVTNFKNKISIVGSFFKNLFSSPIDLLQIGLDVAGMIPGAGVVFDAINMNISGARGDEMGAAMSAMAMIPAAGIAAGGAAVGRRLASLGAKLFKTSVKVAGMTLKHSKLLISGRGLKAILAARGVGHPAKKAMILMRAGFDKGSTKFLLDNSIVCFVAGTKVTTKDGLVNIEDIKVGDQVLSKDPKTGEESFKPVVQLFKSEKSELYHLEYKVNETGKTETLTTTPEHPFFVKEKDHFMEAQALKPGDTFVLANGKTATLTLISAERAPPGKTTTVYNFEVEDFHTYFVGEAKVWVHNVCISEKLSREASDILRTKAREIWQSTSGRRAIWDDLQVHHRIPLEWSHVFSKVDPNRLANLVGMKSKPHSGVSKIWATFKKGLSGRAPSQKEIMEVALSIDKQFGHLMVFPK